MNADKLNETEDDYMEDDSNIGNYILDNINYRIIPCYYLHFNFNNLKTNPAFYVLLIIFILVVIFFIKFFCFGMQRLKGLLVARNFDEMKIIGFYHQCHHERKNKSNPVKKSLFAKNKGINDKKVKDTESARVRIRKEDLLSQTKSKSSNSSLMLHTDFPKKNKKKKKKQNIKVNNKFFEKKKIVERNKGILKTFSFDKSAKMEKLTYNLNDRIDEYMTAPYDTAILKRQKNICYLFYYLLFYKIDTLHIFDRNRFFVDLCVCHILTSFVLIFFFDAFFYSDEIVSHKYHSNGKLDLGVSICLGLVSILLTLAIVYYLKRGIVFKRRMRKILEIKNEKVYQKQLKEFFKSLYIQISIAFVIELLIIAWGYYYIIIFFIIYHQSRKNLFINFLITLLVKVLITLVYVFLLLLIRMISVGSKISCLYNATKFIYEIF